MPWDTCLSYIVSVLRVPCTASSSTDCISSEKAFNHSNQPPLSEESGEIGTHTRLQRSFGMASVPKTMRSLGIVSS